MATLNRPISILGATLLLFIHLAFSEQLIGERSPDVVGWAQGIAVPAAVKYNGTSTKTSPVLDGRSLVDSWLGPRDFVCSDPGWQACPTQLGCCPTAQLCCSSTPYCKNATTDTCCAFSGTCPQGWECTALCQCIESGGECCADGNYCQKGNICVISSYGAFGCCTDLSCTAYVTNGATVPSTPTYNPTQPATTSPPKPTITQGSYYYFTITWSYYFYYYYTFVQVVTTSTLTSSYTTVYTTVSVYGTNSADASSSFESISSALVPSTPAAATTALAQPTGSTTSPTITAAPTFSTSSTLFPTFSLASKSTTSTINTSLHAGGGAVTTNAGAASQVFGATVTGSWTIVAMAIVAFIPGAVMLLL